MTVRLLIGDCRDRLRALPDQSVQCVVTSPPYFGLRDYGVDGQLGAEPTPQEFVAALREVFREVWRVLCDDGTVWLNLGDSYANDGKWGGSSGGKHAKALHGDTSIGRTKVQTGLKSKDLIGIPWRAAFALQDDGWYLRQDIIWNKPNPMPESVRDRCTKAHEYLFMLTKSPRYYYDQEAIKESAIHAGRVVEYDGTQKNSEAASDPKMRTRINHDTEVGEKRIKRSVWEVSTRPYSGAHFATFPPALVEPCIRAGTAAGDTVLDPFAGSGTTGYVADYLQRDAVLVELNPKYAELIRERLSYAGMFNPLEVA